MIGKGVALFCNYISLAAAQALGGAAPGGGGGGSATGSVVTTTSYLNAPTVPHPNLVEGPWMDADHLEGTWSSKSMMVMTGPDFYDPIDELLIEPALPGISFSFTKDGYWEQAMYQITSEPSNNSCSTGALTFQHGIYNITNGRLKLTPFADDGRQLVSDPCKNGNVSEYNQYDQQLTMSKFEVSIDLYYGRYRLDLYQFDGTPLPPMYLVFRPPQMLPTETLTPGVKNLTLTYAASNGKRNTRYSVRDRVKRSLVNRARTTAVRDQTKPALYNTIWWCGMSMMFLGATVFVYLS